MKREKTGFTLVELLTVLAIISLLVGLLIPSLTMIRNTAKNAKQKSQLAEIGLALRIFQNNYGDYPPSGWGMPPDPTYCGAQKLAEALLGWDLLGFHPDSHWQADGRNNMPITVGGIPYPPDGYFFYDTTNPLDMDKRRGPYLEQATANAFRLGNNPARPQDPEGLFPNSTPLNPDRYVICDSFGVKKMTIAPGVTAKAGTPILYYRANTASKTIEPPTGYDQRIYNVYDNSSLIGLRSVTKDGTPGQEHAIQLGGNLDLFYAYIRDLKVTAKPWPYRPDSYILISAGADGLYGTKDDICNFGN